MGDTLLPILKDTKDPHYRYKMPKLTAKVEGSGNGIKTVITNMTAIARALGRPPSYPTKYFGCELGAQVTMDKDFVVNGSHDPEKLLNLLYGFIRKFVLCSKCNNPETTLSIVNGNIKQKCIACGHESIIPKAIHKLTTFIINHPPDGSNPKVGKKDLKKSKKNDTNGTVASCPNAASLSPKNNDQNAFEADNLNDNNDNFDDEDFEEDFTNSEQVANDELVGTMSSKESADLFYNIVKEKKEANVLMEVNVHKELMREAERLDFKDKAILILCELLFTEEMFDEIKTHRLLLLRFCNENKKAQKYLLGAFEKLVGDVYKDKLFNNSVKILKQFYDEDIIDEEVIIEWSAKESKKYVSKEMSKKIHEKVAPFIKWLKEAEEEDDDDDEDEDDDDQDEDEAEVKKANKKEASKNDSKAKANKAASKADNSNEDDDDEMFEFSHRVSGLTVQAVKEPAPSKPVVTNAPANEEEDDDFDIDNI